MRAAVRSSYAAIWVATAVGILVAGFTRPLFDVDAPRDALQASPATAVDLLVHNTLVALWPLALVALDWPQLRGARTAGDVLVAGQLALHGLLVGAAVGQQPSLWRYLPHLPAEWLPRGTSVHPRRVPLAHVGRPWRPASTPVSARGRFSRKPLTCGSGDPHKGG